MSSYLPLLLLLIFCVILPAKRRKEIFVHHAIQKIKKKKLSKEERMKMYELLKRFIGKRCSITIMNSSVGVLGTITEIQDNWVIIDTDGSNNDAINIDFITRVTEWPVKEKKKK